MSTLILHLIHLECIFYSFSKYTLYILARISSPRNYPIVLKRINAFVKTKKIELYG